MKALLLSAYDAESHQLWRHNLKQMFPHIEWVELILPPRYFSWRVRGNSLSWAFGHPEKLDAQYDFLLCTSMTDLSALRGFAPALTRLRSIVYFHENQFAYPANPNPLAERTNIVEAQMLSIYTALCADRIIFNSHWNRNSFIEGAEQLLRKLPDHVPTGLIAQLSRSKVIPVPLADALFQGSNSKMPAPEQALDIVWNHRWEYDKGPALLLAIIQLLVQDKVYFRLHLLGQRFRQAPPEFIPLQQILNIHNQAHGFATPTMSYLPSRDEYLQVLSRADVVLSTALHDFQGLALLEAIALGCTPLAPARLVYPEYLEDCFLYTDSPALHKQAAVAASRLRSWAKLKQSGRPLPKADVRQFQQSNLLPHYEELFTSAPTSIPSI
jgi:glycosyltransferase involved in cell wall biosynthesis